MEKIKNYCKFEQWQKSHIILCLASCILSIFAIASGITLYVKGAEIENASGLGGLTTYFLIISLIVSVLAGITIFASWKKITWYMHFYQFINLVLFVSFILVLIILIMINVNTTSTTGQNSCYSPTNYFQLKMLQLSDKAQSLYCTPTCPCPQYTQVQNCPTWTPTTYDLVMQQLQQQFKCSGWCVPDKNKQFVFNTGQPGLATVACRDQWLNWLSLQWRAVIICVTFMLSIFFVNVIITNWRIIQIWNQQTKY